MFLGDESLIEQEDIGATLSHLLPLGSVPGTQKPEFQKTAASGVYMGVSTQGFICTQRQNHV